MSFILLLFLTLRDIPNPKWHTTRKEESKAREILNSGIWEAEQRAYFRAVFDQSSSVADRIMWWRMFWVRWAFLFSFWTSPGHFFSPNEWFARSSMQYMLLGTCRLPSLRYTMRERSGISPHVLGELNLACSKTRGAIRYFFPSVFSWDFSCLKICHVRWFDCGGE